MLMVSPRLQCGCVRNLSPCPAAVRLWDDVAAAHHELTEISRQLDLEMGRKMLRHEVVGGLRRQKREWEQLYDQSVQLHEEHYQAEAEEMEQVGLL